MTAALERLADLAIELQPDPLPLPDVMRTVVGALGVANVAGSLGVFTHEVQSWHRGGMEWVVPPEHGPALRRIALRLAAAMLAAGSEGTP